MRDGIYVLHNKVYDRALIPTGSCHNGQGVLHILSLAAIKVRVELSFLQDDDENDGDLERGYRKVSGSAARWRHG